MNKHTLLYELIGLPTRTSSRTEISKSFVQQSLIIHQDKVIFANTKTCNQVVCQARNILMNEETKRIYDAYGVHGLQFQKNISFDIEDGRRVLKEIAWVKELRGWEKKSSKEAAQIITEAKLEAKLIARNAEYEAKEKAKKIISKDQSIN